MIRNVLIVLLSVLSFATAIVFGASFVAGPNGILCDVIDTQNTVAIVRLRHGGASFYSMKVEQFEVPVPPSFPKDGPEIDALHAHLAKARGVLKGAYREIMISVEKQAEQREWSNMIRFGFAAPSPNVQTSPKQVPGMGYMVFPLWVPLLLFAAYPILVFIRGPLSRRARRKRNECVHCGYNMTGNESGVCPECGELIND